jgi:Ser/Thr protein kinase RdoA (MazF antagonist)
MNDKEVIKYLEYIISAAIYKNGGAMTIPKKYIDRAKDHNFEIVDKGDNFVLTLYRQE